MLPGQHTSSALVIHLLSISNDSLINQTGACSWSECQNVNNIMAASCYFNDVFLIVFFNHSTLALAYLLLMHEIMIIRRKSERLLLHSQSEKVPQFSAAVKDKIIFNFNNSTSMLDCFFLFVFCLFVLIWTQVDGKVSWTCWTKIFKVLTRNMKDHILLLDTLFNLWKTNCSRTMIGTSMYAPPDLFMQYLFHIKCKNVLYCTQKMLQYLKNIWYSVKKSELLSATFKDAITKYYSVGHKDKLKSN